MLSSRLFLSRSTEEEPALCGLTVFLSSPGSSSNETLNAQHALQSLHHRGPDDEGIFQLPESGLTMTSNRLAIQDLSIDGHMPMTSLSERYTIVFNGEVYNFKELRAQLVRGGASFRSAGDTEVVLNMFEAFGPGSVSKLRGMFAFVIWDARNRTIFAARDHLGIKPLYYAQLPSGIVVASEIKAILQASSVSAVPDETSLRSALKTGSVTQPWTSIESIRELPPATTMESDGAVVSLSSFWHLGSSVSLPSSGTRGAAAEVRRLLESSVAEQMISDVPIAVFLSGGIDSSAVAVLASRNSTDPLHTVSIGFQEPKYSEAEASRRIARLIGAEHSEVTVTEADAIDSFDGFITAMDQPTGDGFNTYFVARATRQAGAKVALSGLGGDELFGGYPSFSMVPRLAGVYRRGARLGIPKMPGEIARALGRVGSPRIQRVGLAYKSSDDPWLAAYAAVRGIIPPSELNGISFNGYLDGSDMKRLAEVPLSFENNWQQMSNFDRVSALEIRGYMLNQLLRDADVFSMAHSLELRVPLLDCRLVEFLFSLPEPQKAGGKKQLLVDSMGSDLPGWLVELPKMGFSFPWDPWLRGDFGKMVRAKGRDATADLNELGWRYHTEIFWERFLQKKAPWTQPWIASIVALWLQRLLFANVAAECSK